MPTTITRRQISQIRSVLRRAFGNNRGAGPALSFIADAEGLTVKTKSADIAVECHIPGVYAPAAIWLPFQFLADCGGKDCRAKNDDLITIESVGEANVTVQWTDHGVPQVAQYNNCAAPQDADKFPIKPVEFAENPPRLLKALVDAGEICDPDSARYALACLQLRGPQGSIAATDGQQLMHHSGFTFPWDGDLLVRRNKIFASPELAGDHLIFVGKADDWIAFCCGPWTIWLAINKDGRFPDVTRHIPQSAAATARCQFSATDANFLGQALSRLPRDGTSDAPITLDLNGHIAFRAQAADRPQPTEVVLSNSSWTGEPIRISSNRKFLARALKLGFRELCVYGDSSPVACFDDGRTYVWAPLDSESAIKPAADAIRIESPQIDPLAPATLPKPKLKKEKTRMTEPITANNGHVAKTDKQPKQKKTNPQDMVALIERAIKLRTDLHNLMHEAGELVKALKQHRRQNRAVQQTLAQIRSLKTLV